MKTKICEICGCEFSAMTLGQKYCRDCHEELYRSIKPEQPKRNPNQRLIDEVKAAAEYVTTAVTEDGVYNGLKHYGLIEG